MLNKKEVFCIFCRYARLHKTLLFSIKYNDPFSLKGYDNMNKALENFQAHYCAESHMEAKTINGKIVDGTGFCIN